MLHYKSKPEEILFYIEQMKLLLLSDKEKKQIQQIMSLDNLIKDDSVDLIAEDIQFKSWVKKTQILINKCCQKIEKSLLVENHIEDCKNFIVYRYLEEKLKLVEYIEIQKQLGGWNFNEIDVHERKSKWLSQKFIQSFENSSCKKFLESSLQEGNILQINLMWLHEHREGFFSDNMFLDLNIQLKNQHTLLQV